jgi:hypothetical protein
MKLFTIESAYLSLVHFLMKFPLRTMNIYVRSPRHLDLIEIGRGVRKIQ